MVVVVVVHGHPSLPAPFIGCLRHISSRVEHFVMTLQAPLTREGVCMAPWSHIITPSMGTIPNGRQLTTKRQPPLPRVRPRF